MTAKTQKLLYPFKRVINEKINEGYPADNICLEYGYPSPYKEKEGYFLTCLNARGRNETISGVIHTGIFKDETDLKKMCEDFGIQYNL